jgi:hypothetical protein
MDAGKKFKNFQEQVKSPAAARYAERLVEKRTRVAVKIGAVKELGFSPLVVQQLAHIIMRTQYSYQLTMIADAVTKDSERLGQAPYDIQTWMDHFPGYAAANFDVKEQAVAAVPKLKLVFDDVGEATEAAMDVLLPQTKEREEQRAAGKKIKDESRGFSHHRFMIWNHAQAKVRRAAVDAEKAEVAQEQEVKKARAEQHAVDLQLYTELKLLTPSQITAEQRAEYKFEDSDKLTTCHYCGGYWSTWVAGDFMKAKTKKLWKGPIALAGEPDNYNCTLEACMAKMKVEDTRRKDLKAQKAAAKAAAEAKGKKRKAAPKSANKAKKQKTPVASTKAKGKRKTSSATSKPIASKENRAKKKK